MHERSLAEMRPYRPWCATCLAYGPALRPRSVDGTVFLFCEGCDDHDVRTLVDAPPHHEVGAGPSRGRPWRRKHYWPLDESERDPSFRILRIVQRFDWVTSGDVRELLGIAGVADDRTAHNNFSVRISFLTRTGFLRRRHLLEFVEYQITDLGRARIENWTRAAIEQKGSIAA